MTSEEQQRLLLVLVGLALLWLVLRRRAGQGGTVTGGGANVAPGGAGALPGASTAPPPIQVVPRAPTQPPFVDVAGTVNDGAADILQDNGTSAGSAGGWQLAFYEQLWLPASRLKLSDLGIQDWVYATEFLQNSNSDGFERRDDLGLLGRVLIQNAKDQQGSAILTGILGSVASLIPIVGGILSKGYAGITSTLNAGADWDTAMGNGRLGSLLKDSLGQPTQKTRHLLANYGDGTSAYNGGMLVDGPDAHLDRQTMDLPPDLVVVPCQNFRPENPLWTGAGTIRVRMRLFSKYQGGWLLPWLCWRFNGDPTTSMGLRSTVNARARIYRAVDAIICQFAPFVRENAPNGYWAEKPLVWVGKGTPRASGAGTAIGDRTLYYYRNPLVGPMLGSIFPPTVEDTRYVGTDGRTYSFYGEPMNTPAGTVGALSDVNIDPNPKVAATVAAHRAL